ncbi:MAG: hypothetical protein V2I41_09670 [Pseudomonadales bacterium]|nr:hypothetical protein [Pseudomonadales bacterium]
MDNMNTMAMINIFAVLVRFSMQMHPTRLDGEQHNRSQTHQGFADSFHCFTIDDISTCRIRFI